MHLSQTDALFGYACAELRPQWDGVKVSALQEAIYLATTPQSAALLCAPPIGRTLFSPRS